MNSREIYILVFLISVFISSISQIILKKSTTKKYDNKLKEYLNMRVIFAYGMFFLASLLTTLAYKGVPLSLGPVLEATGYIYIAILGTLILKEKMSKKKIIGNILIIIGIIVFSLK